MVWGGQLGEPDVLLLLLAFSSVVVGVLAIERCFKVLRALSWHVPLDSCESG